MSYREASEIVEDTEKGAAELVEDAAEGISELSEEEINNYLIRVLQGRYLMTPLVNLVNEIFLTIEMGGDPFEAADKFSSNIRSNKKKAAENAVDLLNGYDHLITLSYSSTVMDVLKETEKVTVLESRPVMEGRRTALRLSKEGVKVRYWVDAGMVKALKDAEVVLVGADAVNENGFVNKIGTAPLALAARDEGKPFYVVSDTSKILPQGLPICTGEEHPSDEVWKPSADVEVKNDYFEFTEWSHCRLITENGEVEDIGKLTKKEVSDKLLKYHPMV